MSNWTHVAAIFRCDGLIDWGINPDEELGDSIERIFGKQIPQFPEDIDDDAAWRTFDAEMRNAAENPDEYVPCGSEGGLQISIWENPDKSHAARYTISVFGDLRDYHDNESIHSWFVESCNKVGLLRQAVCTSWNEWFGTETWTYEYPVEND